MGLEETFLVTFVLNILLFNCVELVVVEVEQGLLLGQLRNRSTGNGLVCSFKGIPYAQPPIGQLRFMAPQPPSKWVGIRNATQHGPKCPQITSSSGKYIPGNEDCLYLNVYTPTTNFTSSLPVMFFIHGGRFVAGSGNEDKYGPDFLLDQNVVVVTFNFRLGALGFLCLDIKEVPGNAGLKDQVAALQWVRRNIGKFGGNPNRITIFGQSSGGSAVSLHVLSPMSKGLFKHAIAMSGVCFNEISTAFEPRRQALLLAHKVGLYTKDPYQALQFLQNASVQAIITAKPYLTARNKLQGDAFQQLTFPPVVEKQFGCQHFLVEKPEVLLLSGQTNVNEIVLGYTSEEGTMQTISKKDYIFNTYPYFTELLVPSIITKQLNTKEVLRVADCIQQHYFGNRQISPKNIRQFINFYGYYVFVTPIYRYLEMWTKGGNRAYLYEFSCFSERNINGIKGLPYGVRAATHEDDLMYVFDGKQYNIPLNKTKPSYKMIVQTNTLLTNFAKYGNPTPGRSFGTRWQYYNRKRSIFNIDYDVSLQRTTSNEINFWKRLYYYASIRFS